MWLFLRVMSSYQPMFSEFLSSVIVLGFLSLIVLTILYWYMIYYLRPFLLYGWIASPLPNQSIISRLVHNMFHLLRHFFFYPSMSNPVMFRSKQKWKIFFCLCFIYPCFASIAHHWSHICLREDVKNHIFLLIPLLFDIWFPTPFAKFLSPIDTRYWSVICIFLLLIVFSVEGL